MTAQKKEDSAAQTQDAAGGKPGGATGESGTKRKPWIKKTPVEIILEQVAKQQEKVEALRKELTKEEGELKKMQDATKLLQAK
jgi:hypothetical protein